MLYLLTYIYRTFNKFDCPQMFTSLLICVLKVHEKSSNAQLYFNNAFHGSS